MAIQDNLTSYWTFDTNFNDSIGTNHGSAGGGSPTIVAGKFGNGMSLNGAGDFLNIPGTDFNFQGNNFSISLWYKPADHHVFHSLFASATDLWFGFDYDYTTNRIGLWGSSTAGGWDIWSSQEPGGTGTDFTDADLPAPGNWFSLIFVRNGTSWKIWTQGANTFSKTSAASITSRVENRVIGAWNSSMLWANGIFDDYAIWNRALTDGEVNAIYAAGAAGNPLSTLLSTPVAITEVAYPNGVQGAPYVEQLNATGTELPFAWSKTAGPSWLTVTTNGSDSTKADLTGTPDAAAVTSTTTHVVDDASNTDDLIANLTVTKTTIGAVTLSDAKVNVAYYYAMTVSGGTAPYVWALAAGSTALPAWLSLNTGVGPTYNGVLSGTPLAEATTTGLKFKVTDANNISAETGLLSLTVNPGTGQFDIESSSGTILMASIRMFVQDAEPTEARAGDEWLNSTNVVKKRNYADSSWLTISTT